MSCFSLSLSIFMFSGNCKRKLFTPHFVFNLQEHQALRLRERVMVGKREGDRNLLARKTHSLHFLVLRKGKRLLLKGEGIDLPPRQQTVKRMRREAEQREHHPLSLTRSAVLSPHRFIRLITSAAAASRLKAKT